MSWRLGNRGVALLIVLWVLVILTSMVFSFSLFARTETFSTRAFKETAEKRFLARAGVEKGIMELFFRGLYRDRQPVPGDPLPIKVDGTRYENALGADFCAFRVMDESGKINLNLLTDQTGLLLNNLLVHLGVAKEEADIIVDSVLDWKDGDELHRLHGAESDYYGGLPNPYKSKNGNFNTVEELLMVRGVTPAVLYGTDQKPGIFEFLTVHSKAGGINVQTAPREVLLALPSMTREMAEAILAARLLQDFKGTLEQVRSIVGAAFSVMQPYIGSTESNIYTIESTGYKKGGRQGLTIRATVAIEAHHTYRYLYYKSPAAAKKWEGGTGS